MNEENYLLKHKVPRRKFPKTLESEWVQSWDYQKIEFTIEGKKYCESFRKKTRSNEIQNT